MFRTDRFLIQFSIFVRVSSSYDKNKIKAYNMTVCKKILVVPLLLLSNVYEYPDGCLCFG